MLRVYSTVVSVGQPENSRLQNVRKPEGVGELYSMTSVKFDGVGGGSHERSHFGQHRHGPSDSEEEY